MNTLLQFTVRQRREAARSPPSDARSGARAARGDTAHLSSPRAGYHPSCYGYPSNAVFTIFPGSLGVPFQSLMIAGKLHPPGYQAHAVHETFFASAAWMSCEV